MDQVPLFVKVIFSLGFLCLFFFYLAVPKEQIQTPRRNKMDRERGQGLIEYALILVIVAVIVIVVLSLCSWVFVVVIGGGAGLVIFWDQIVSWVAGIVQGVQQGNSTAIAVAIIVGLILLFFIFGRRR